MADGRPLFLTLLLLHLHKCMSTNVTNVTGIVTMTFTRRKLQEYQAAYQTHKGLRTLEWKPHLGTVDVDLVLADRELSFSVSPIRATIIYQFQQQSEPCLLFLCLLDPKISMGDL